MRRSYINSHKLADNVPLGGLDLLVAKSWKIDMTEEKKKERERGREVGWERAR